LFQACNCVDPPWPRPRSPAGATLDHRFAAFYYQVLSVRKFPFPELTRTGSRNSVLLWTTSPLPKLDLAPFALSRYQKEFKSRAAIVTSRPASAPVRLSAPANRGVPDATVNPHRTGQLKQTQRPSSATPASSVVHVSPGDTGSARVSVPVVTISPAASWGLI